MKSLGLDYQRSNRPLRRISVVALAVVLVLLGWQLMQQQKLQKEISAQKLALQQRDAEQAPHIARTLASPEELAAARGVLAKFSLPWGELLDAVEAVKVEKVALLSIEPGVGENKLVITGEAQDYLDVLNYVAGLRAQKVLSNVHLSHHEVRKGQGRLPVVFSVSADWGMASS